MKNLFIMLALILGIGLTLTSCSKHTDLENAQEQNLEVYKQGSVNVLISYKDSREESEILQTNQSLLIFKSEVESLTVEALEDNTTIRINGYIYHLEKVGDIKVFKY